MAQHLQHDFGVFGVEVSSRLVCKHDRGPIDQRPCQSNSLLLAAGEFRWPMRQPLTQAKKTNNLVKVRGVAGAVLSRYVNRDFNIRSCVERWQQIEFLKYEPNLCFAKLRTGTVGELRKIRTINKDLTEVRPRQSPHQIKKGDLPPA